MDNTIHKAENKTVSGGTSTVYKTEINNLAKSVNDYKALKPSQRKQELVLHSVLTCATTLVKCTYGYFSYNLWRRLL